MSKIAVTIPEAVQMSGLGRSTLYQAIGSKQLPIRKAGSRTLILVDDLRAFLENLPSVAA